jgi:stalled ribosome rescue protein Dom34
MPPRKQPAASSARKRPSTPEGDEAFDPIHFNPAEIHTMTTFHAVVWLDHSEAHVLMFDREHVEAQRIKSRSHHKHQGKDKHDPAFFPAIVAALAGTHEVLLTGPGAARNELRDWCTAHHPAVAKAIVDSIAADHPTDGQLVALARKYFARFDNMAADPSTL